jgi:hypothetical protein
MKTIIGYLVWLALRAFVFVTRRPSMTFRTPAGAPYMTRWALATRDRWPDAEGRTGGEGWYLHRIVASDYERELHNHPAPGVSVPLRVGYLEERIEGRGGQLYQAAHRRWFRRAPLSFHVVDSETFHRVELRTHARACVRRGRFSTSARDAVRGASCSPTAPSSARRTTTATRVHASSAMVR